MILGVSSFTYGWSVGVPGNLPDVPMDEQELIGLTLGANLRCLQIGDNLPLHTFSDERLRNLRVNIEDNDIRLEIGARKLTSAHLQLYIVLAVFLGSPLIRFVTDDFDYEPDNSEITAIIKDALPELQKNNITLGIENHDRLGSRDLAGIIESIGSDHVGICLDCVNSLGAGEGLEQVSEILGPYTVNVHLKDFTIQRMEHKMGFIVTGAPAGKGMLNAKQLLNTLLPFNRCETAIIEQWVIPEEGIEHTVRKEKQWAEEGLQYLKQLPHFHNFQTIL